VRRTWQSSHGPRSQCATRRRLEEATVVGQGVGGVAPAGPRTGRRPFTDRTAQSRRLSPQEGTKKPRTKKTRGPAQLQPGQDRPPRLRARELCQGGGQPIDASKKPDRGRALWAPGPGKRRRRGAPWLVRWLGALSSAHSGGRVRGVQGGELKFESRGRSLTANRSVSIDVRLRQRSDPLPQ